MMTPHTPSEILRLARAKIDTPEKWTQGEYARDMFGGKVPEDAPDAVCFCSIGAIFAAGKGERARASEDAFMHLVHVVGDVITFNDGPLRTHAEVLTAFDRAIRLADQGRQGE